MDCVSAGEVKLGRSLTDEEQTVLLFEASHSMFPTTEELKQETQCPLCEGYNTKITLLETTQSTFIRGGDWREFKKKNAGALQRDMALHQLQNNDPYGYMRPAGEKAELVDRLRAGSKKPSKQKHFLT